MGKLSKSLGLAADASERVADNMERMAKASQDMGSGSGGGGGGSGADSGAPSGPIIVNLYGPDPVGNAGSAGGGAGPGGIRRVGNDLPFERSSNTLRRFGPIGGANVDAAVAVILKVAQSMNNKPRDPNVALLLRTEKGS